MTTYKSTSCRVVKTADLCAAEHCAAQTIVRWVFVGWLVMGTAVTADAETRKDYPVKPVPFTDVHVADQFWAPRIETNRTVSIPFAFKNCEETGRIDNFSKAAGLMEGQHVGIRFDDSDVYKIMEGAAYSIRLHPDPDLEKYLAALIATVSAAQEDDGYLYTARTIDPEHPAKGAGDQRWSNLRWSHELYCAGHMYEAAVAHYMATGKRSFLDVAISNADLIDSVFGPGKKRDVPGHQEIEIGLAKLYRVTGNEKYLKLAKFFLDERGHAHGRELYGSYTQDHKPVIEQHEAVGHAVRAAYMYSGMADVAALTGDTDYVEALDRIWANVVSEKLYLTGGIGASRRGEAFGGNYELPNKSAYNETCAAIGNVLWNHRLFLLHGDAKYIDVLERTLYNGLISGVSLEGDSFFYPNPLESDGEYKFNQGSATRSPWFRCACCPGNVTRFVPSIPGYAYAYRDNVLYVSLFVSGSATGMMANVPGRITQTTRYPWDGTVKMTIEPERPAEFAVYVRIPGWARNRPVPSDLYQYMNSSNEEATLKVNGRPVALDIEKGFARIQRTWQRGDTIELELPMPVRRVVAHEKVEANVGKVAIERGPIVYCAEAVDNGGHVLDLVLPDDAPLETEFRQDMLGGVTVVTGTARALARNAAAASERDFVAIPYYAWSHRGVGEMAVWLHHGG